jgi:hypothetical protein
VLCLCARYEDAIVTLKAKVKETEGEDMREAIQDKVRRQIRLQGSLLSQSIYVSSLCMPAAEAACAVHDCQQLGQLVQSRLGQHILLQQGPRFVSLCVW